MRFPTKFLFLLAAVTPLLGSHSGTYKSSERLPDLCAVQGRVFSFQLQPEHFSNTSLPSDTLLVSSLGSNKPPRWLEVSKWQLRGLPLESDAGTHNLRLRLTREGETRVLTLDVRPKFCPNRPGGLCGPFSPRLEALFVFPSLPPPCDLSPADRLSLTSLISSHLSVAATEARLSSSGVLLSSEEHQILSKHPPDQDVPPNVPLVSVTLSCDSWDPLSLEAAPGSVVLLSLFSPQLPWLRRRRQTDRHIRQILPIELELINTETVDLPFSSSSAASMSVTSSVLFTTFQSPSLVSTAASTAITMLSSVMSSYTRMLSSLSARVTSSLFTTRAVSSSVTSSVLSSLTPVISSTLVFSSSVVPVFNTSSRVVSTLTAVTSRVISSSVSSALSISSASIPTTSSVVRMPSTTTPVRTTSLLATNSSVVRVSSSLVPVSSSLVPVSSSLVPVSSTRVQTSEFSSFSLQSSSIGSNTSIPLSATSSTPINSSVASVSSSFFQTVSSSFFQTVSRSSSLLANTSQVPVTSSIPPDTSSSVPIASSSVPIASSSVPVTSSIPPDTSSSVPIASSSVPVTSSIPPDTSSSVPIASSSVPVTSSVVMSTSSVLSVSPSLTVVTSQIAATSSAVPSSSVYTAMSSLSSLSSVIDSSPSVSLSPSATPSLTSSLVPTSSNIPVSSSPQTASVSSGAVMSSTPVTSPPPVARITLTNPLPLLIPSPGVAFSYNLPTNTFSQPASNLSLRLASLVGELPDWLFLSSSARGYQLVMLPPIDSGGKVFYVSLVATDQSSTARDVISIRPEVFAPPIHSVEITIKTDLSDILKDILNVGLSLTRRIASVTNSSVRLLSLSAGSTVIRVSFVGAEVSRDCSVVLALLSTIQYSNGSYTKEFITAFDPYELVEFAVGQGLCLSGGTLPPPPAVPALSESVSHLVAFLGSTVVAILLASLLISVCCVLVVCCYRCKRYSGMTAAEKKAFLKRRPVVMDADWSLPPKARTATILPTDLEYIPEEERWLLGPTIDTQPPPAPPRPPQARAPPPFQ